MLNMETGRLDFVDKDERAGFRLWRFEVFNWGTFDSCVWPLAPEGHNSLLTGDIGSGKSTLVDALTTLLVSPQHITYNKAAGAETRERTLGSYVRGAYKMEKDETQLSAKPVHLRKEGSYSVLLGYFFNEGYQIHLTLAQVFWAKDGKNQPDRFYILSERDLSVAKDFSGFANITELKKRLRKQPDILLFETFSQYAAEFRRRMDIRSEQALDLFYKTVSMKSVGNLTEFVRAHMLEETPVKDRIEEICRDFENLNRTHEAVLKARDQIQLLEPLVGDCDRLAEVRSQINAFRRCREALRAYFAGLMSALLEEFIMGQEAEFRKLTDQLVQMEENLNSLRRQQEEIRQSIAESGGSRLESLAQQIERLQIERQRRSVRAEEYAQFCKALGLASGPGIDPFHANRSRAEELRTQFENEREKKQKQKIDIQIVFKKTEEQMAQLLQELDSLRGRESNIPLESLVIRRRLCETLSIEEADLLFAGELLQVRKNAAAWEGALERVLHNFGRSLLVPEELYSRVAHYADATHLGGRLVYFRIRKEKSLFHEEISDLRLLTHKLEIKPDTPFYDWLEQELARHFNYVCCETLEEFQREVKALTRHGQTKSQGRRHEKDDRFRLDERSRYVLGWNNKAKIKVLEEKQHGLDGEMQKKAAEMTSLERDSKNLEESRDKVLALLGIREFAEIDWASLAQQIADFEEERKRLLKESDVLRTLQASLAGIQTRIRQAEQTHQKSHGERAVIESRIAEARMMYAEALKEIESLPKEERSAVFPELEKMKPEALGEKILTVKNCSTSERDMRGWIQARLDADDKKDKYLVEKILLKMSEFKTRYPLDTQELDAHVEAAEEFRVMLKRLQGEDLPRFEDKFRRLLKEGTINHIAMFQSQLDKERREILDKIQRINKSLREIEYSSGTYIELVSDPAKDIEVREFQQDLKVCLEGTLGTDDEDLYTERKFLEVKKIIDRFKGRVGMGIADLDRKWTEKVTDVRNWFDFSVSEIWKETGEMKEFYSDSSGKSGGQKEKLAYTILASALAYQFGLEWGVRRSRSFRFVMIDEAFGRGSDESARYGLELFKKLNLQLLIVTPLQKIHVIEDYVRSVHLTHNRNGHKSQLQSFSIEEYREEKKRREQQAALAPLS